MNFKDLPKLTPKQDRAVRHYIEHGSKAAAFRHAYAHKGWTKNSIQVNACKLFDNAMVSLWVEFYQDRMQETFEATVDGITGKLIDAVNLGLQTKTDAQGNKIAHNIAGAVSALAELNKMAGNHAPVKTAFTGADGESLDISGAAASLNAKLAKLAAGAKKKRVPKKPDRRRGGKS